MSDAHDKPEPQRDAALTLFMCGPSKCMHDYSEGENIPEGGWTAVCSKCGARAIDEAAWL